MTMRNASSIAVILLASANALSAQAGTADRSLPGFTAEAAERQRSMERMIIGAPSGERMLEYHRAMTVEPHHAGTPANERTAEYYADRLREFGFDRVIMNRYHVLLPRPLERQVTLLAPERYELRLEEPPLDPDPDTRMDGVLPPFNAYSADGDVTAEVVYVNYGIPSDYAVLDSLGISVEGRIVLARYGRSWRGIKPRLAAERGAIGALIYSDPEDDGYVRGDVMPDGKWRPEHGVQRGSVMDMPTYPGDPQTPMRPSREGVDRIPLEEVQTLQTIPVLPISYGDALPILRNLGGALAPNDDWQGGLPLAYHLGPGPARVHMRLAFDWSVRPIVNVIGILEGSDEPDRIVMAGGHRDAWTFGGRDPISGAVSLLETARVLGELARAGHRPRRSLAFASWDGEEYGLIGSTEYGEEFGDRLRDEMVVYLNRESYTAGDFDADGVHSLQPFMSAVAADVEMPGRPGTSVLEAWVESAGEDRRLDTAKAEGPGSDLRETVRLGALGSGSDYTVFLDHLGIPSMDIGFSSGNGIYHSRYDTHWYFTNYGDPGFEHGERLAEVVALFMLRLANADLLPFDFASSAETIERYLDELEVEADRAGPSLARAVDLDAVRGAARRLATTAAALGFELDRIQRLPAADLRRSAEAVARINDLLLAAEKGFLHPEGLPGRPWYRHQLYAPGFFTGYGVKTLPGIREAIEARDGALAGRMAEDLILALERVRSTLGEAIAAAVQLRQRP